MCASLPFHLSSALLWPFPSSLSLFLLLERYRSLFTRIRQHGTHAHDSWFLRFRLRFLFFLFFPSFFHIAQTRLRTFRMLFFSFAPIRGAWRAREVLSSHRDNNIVPRAKWAAAFSIRLVLPSLPIHPRTSVYTRTGARTSDQEQTSAPPSLAPSPTHIVYTFTLAPLPSPPMRLFASAVWIPRVGGVVCCVLYDASRNRGFGYIRKDFEGSPLLLVGAG